LTISSSMIDSLAWFAAADRAFPVGPVDNHQRR
jgi:hypothetical protein